MKSKYAHQRLVRDGRFKKGIRDRRRRKQLEEAGDRPFTVEEVEQYVHELKAMGLLPIDEFEPDPDPFDDEGVCPNCGAGPDEECEVDCDCDECEGIEALATLDGHDDLETIAARADRVMEEYLAMNREELDREYAHLKRKAETT